MALPNGGAAPPGSTGSSSGKAVPPKGPIVARIMYRKSALVVVLGAIFLVLRRRTSFLQRSISSDPLFVAGTTILKKAVASLNEGGDPLRNRTYAEVSSDAGLDDEDDGVDNDLSIEMMEGHEPYSSRWQRRFASSRSRNKTGGYLFFRHMRKSGGTSLRAYFRDAMAYHNVSVEANDWRAAKLPKEEGYQIHYVEHEFQALDWQCPKDDPRWQEAMNFVVLRHPVERHLSEYFFSGPGTPIDKEQLYVNETYTKELAAHMKEWVPKWMRHIGRRNTPHNKERKNELQTEEMVEVKTRRDNLKGKFNMMFGRYYTDNFQLRAMAGCSTGDCLKAKDVDDEDMERIREYHPSSHSYDTPVSRCTHYFRKPDSPNIIDICAKPGQTKEECLPLGCDGPCFYPSVAWGQMGQKDVDHAVEALKAFDAVLLMEKFDDVDQSDFLSDVLGVPRDADFAMARRGDSSNTGVEKKGKREKTHFYRDLLTKLGLKRSVGKLLFEENHWEIEFFHQAEKVNEWMIKEWKKEDRKSG